MTSDNELRDRIEDTIEAAYAQWEFEFEAHEDGNRAYVDPGPKDAFIAQAIIDEFGMTVETEPGHDPRECGCSSRAYPAESRVVGKWEQR